jgi:hypothetical protein
VSGGVKGPDERRNGALDPATHTGAGLCLDNGQRRHTQDDKSLFIKEIRSKFI